jgi:hypothetical protein
VAHGALHWYAVIRAAESAGQRGRGRPAQRTAP